MPGFRRHREEPDPADLTKAVIEVAAVKANARALIRRIQVALHDLEETVEDLPGNGEEADDVPRAGTERGHDGAPE